MMHMQDIDLTQLPSKIKQTGWIDVAPRPDGSTWRLPFLYVTGNKPGPLLIVTSGVHGDEYEGMEAIPEIFHQTDPQTLSGTLFMIPICNVPAFETISRSSPIDGLNLARVFPGDAEGSITPRIAHLMATKILPNADFYIDLHSGGLTYDIPTLAGYIHAESELGLKSFAGAQAFGAPILWGHPFPIAPGRTLSSAVDLGVPCIYTEATGGGLARANDVACFKKGVFNVMKWLGMLKGDPQAPAHTHHLLGAGNLDQAIQAPVAGYFKPEVTLLQNVQKNQHLGTIRDPFGKTLSQLHANTDGVIIMLRRLHCVRVGDGLVHITKHHTE